LADQLRPGADQREEFQMQNSRRPRVKLRGSKIAPLGAAASVAFGGALHAQTTPVAVDDEFNVVKRDFRQILGNVFENDTADVPRRASAPSIVQDGAYGIGSRGDLLFFELSGDCAATSDQFRYTLRDLGNNDLEASADVRITLLAPVQADMYQIEAGQILADDVQLNDPLPINPINVVDQLEITDFFDAGFGTVQQTRPGVANETGQFTYQPEEGFSGNDSFVYFTPDSDTGCNWNTEVNILVVPVANNDAASTPGGQQVCNIDVLSNDLGTDLALIAVTQPPDATVSISADDTLCFSPDQDFLGTSTFAYTLEDAAGTQADGSVEVDVFNLPPDLANDSFEVTAGQVLEGNVLDNDFDPNDDDLTASLATPAANGNVVLSPNGSFTYTPDAGYSGADGFTYSVDETRARGTSPSAEVEIVVVPVVSDRTITESTDREVAGNLLEGALGTGLSIVDWTRPESGDLTVNPDGSYIYIAPLGFQGTVEFEFTAVDAYGSQVSGSVSLGFALVHAVPGPGTGGLGLLALLLGWLGLRRLR
jgi:hypothetical protein